MRIQVYAEELTDDVGRIEKKVTDGGGTRTFVGVRVYLKSPDDLHNTLEDDDRSAVTFWTSQDPEHRDTLRNALRKMLRELEV